MKDTEKLTFLLWSECDEYLSRIACANEIVIEAISKYGPPYLSFSGGKDSTVLLHMVLAHSPNIPVWHWDYGSELMPRSLELELLQIPVKMGAINLIVDQSGVAMRRNCSTTTYNKYFFKKLAYFGKDYDLAFIGLRKEESGKRRRKAIQPFRQNGKLTECYPLSDLTARDIWAYIVSHNLPYCSHYDRYGALLGIEQVRMSTFFDPEFDHIGASNIDGLLMPEFKNR